MVKKIEDSQVFTATVDVLLAHGYAGAKTKMIADKAGINEVTLFRKYGTKAQLVLAALQHEREAFRAQSIVYSGNLAADLLQMVRLYSEASPRQSQLMMLIMADAIRYPELRETMRVPFGTVAHFGAIIARYQAEGKLQPSDPTLIVGALVGPIVINTMLRSAESDLPVPTIDLQTHVHHFLHGYAT